MSTITFRARLSAEYRRRVLAETGEVAPDKTTLEVDLTQIDQATRAAILPHAESYYQPGLLLSAPIDLAVPALLDIEENEGRYRFGRRPDDTEEYATVNQPLDLPLLLDALRLIDARRAENAARKPQMDARIAAVVAAEKAKQQEVAAKIAAADREREERQRVEREARATDRATWIAEHGSTFLRRAVAAGYDCQRRYATERVAIEHPGAVLDYENHAEWKSRSCPSEAALDLAERVHGTVVWLTSEPQTQAPDPEEYEYEEPFTAQEAVVVNAYLGKYVLVYML